MRYQHSLAREKKKKKNFDFFWHLKMVNAFGVWGHFCLTLLVVLICMEIVSTFIALPSLMHWRQHRAALRCSQAADFEKLGDGWIDLSDGSRKVMKKILRAGQRSSPLPERDGLVEFTWLIYLQRNGTLISNSTINDKELPFIFQVDPKEEGFCRGWTTAISTMRIGEIAMVNLTSDMAFGEEGVKDFIEPNEDIYCVLEVIMITPPLRKLYKNIKSTEGRREEIIEKIKSGEINLSQSYMNSDENGEPIEEEEEKNHHPSAAGAVAGSAAGSETKPPWSIREIQPNLNAERNQYMLHQFNQSASADDGATLAATTTSDGANLGNQQSPMPRPNYVSKPASNAKKKQFFDPTKHSIPDNVRISGRSVGHCWEETKKCLDIVVFIPKGISKKDIQISIK